MTGERWTQPVAGPAGMTASEAQAAYEASQADLDPAERSGPGYTEPPLDWEPERDSELGSSGRQAEAEAEPEIEL